MIASCYYAGFAAGCFYGPRLVQRVGHIRTFTAMTAAAAVAALGYAFVTLPLVWWLLRVGSGICFAVLYMVIESWLSERSTSESRGFVLSAYMIINLTVLTLGQMLMPLHDPKGMELFAIVAMLISLAAVPVALTGASAPAPIASARLRLRRLCVLSPAAVVCCIAVGLANSAFWGLSPLFAQANGLSDSGIALFMSATVIGGAVGQWPLGRLSDRGDRRKVILLASAICSAAGVLLVWHPFGTRTALLATAALWGAAAFPLYTLALAHANDHARPEEFVEVASGLLLVFAAGAVVGPLFAAAVTGAFGIQSLYLYPAAVHGLLIGFVAWRIARKAPVPVADHVDFKDALQAANTVSPVFDEQTQAALAEEAEEAEEERAEDSPRGG